MENVKIEIETIILVILRQNFTKNTDIQILANNVTNKYLLYDKLIPVYQNRKWDYLIKQEI